MIRRLVIVLIVIPLLVMSVPILVLATVLSAPYNYVRYGKVEMDDFLDKILEQIHL